MPCPNFKDPAAANAKKAYVLWPFGILTFGGIAYLSTIYHPVPGLQQTVISQIATAIFGRGVMYYLIQATTAIFAGHGGQHSLCRIPDPAVHYCP